MYIYMQILVLSFIALLTNVGAWPRHPIPAALPSPFLCLESKAF